MLLDNDKLTNLIPTKYSSIASLSLSRKPTVLIATKLSWSEFLIPIPIYFEGYIQGPV